MIQNVAGLIVMTLFFLVVIFVAQGFIVAAYKRYRRKKRLHKVMEVLQKDRDNEKTIEVLSSDADGVPTLIFRNGMVEVY